MAIYREGTVSKNITVMMNSFLLIK